MAAAAMHVRGPGPTRHLSIFQIPRYSLQQLVRYCCCQGESGERLRERASEQDLALASNPHAPSCPCHHHLQVGGFWGERRGVGCVNQPAERIQHPALGAVLWNPPLSTALTSSAGPHCTLPFPALPCPSLDRRLASWAGRDDAVPAADQRTRVSLDHAPLRTTCTVLRT